MEVITIPALSDNYMYVLFDKTTKSCVAVDPVEPDKIIDVLNKHKLDISSVLTTHHHSDHAGGNNDLIKKLEIMGKKGVKVFGGDERIEGITDIVHHGTLIKLGETIEIKCLLTPCHTRGHICYYITKDNEIDSGIVFTGDTLFIGGCGRFFEGTGEQMYKALVETLAKLPPSTKVYCGHEYTYQNLKFGMHVEPSNEHIKAKITAVEKLRILGTPTVPGTIQEELLINPFMRVLEKNVLLHANTSDHIEAMNFIREEKNNFS